MCFGLVDIKTMGRHLGISVLLLLAVVCLKEVDMTPEYLRSISGSFLKVMKICTVELDVPDGILMEFYRFWKEDYENVSRVAGCVLHCMSQKLEFFKEGSLQHGNTKDFAIKHGADVNMAAQLEELVRNCERKASEIPDECLRVLEMAKCVRSNLQQIAWAPSMEVVVEEVAAEA